MQHFSKIEGLDEYALSRKHSIILSYGCSISELLIQACSKLIHGVTIAGSKMHWRRSIRRCYEACYHVSSETKRPKNTTGFMMSVVTTSLLVPFCLKPRTKGGMAGLETREQQGICGVSARLRIQLCWNKRHVGALAWIDKNLADYYYMSAVPESLLARNHSESRATGAIARSKRQHVLRMSVVVSVGTPTPRNIRHSKSDIMVNAWVGRNLQIKPIYVWLLCVVDRHLV